MIKDIFKQKTSKLDYKTDYHYIKESLTNPYSYNLGKCEHSNLNCDTKLHRFIKK